MDLDTITLKFKSVIGKLKSDLSDAIGKYTKLDNELNKVANSMNKIANGTNELNNSFKNLGSVEKIKEMEQELRNLTKEYNRQSKAFADRPAYMSSTIYNPTLDHDPNAAVFVDQNSLNQQKAAIDELQQKINDLKGTISTSVDTRKLVPKELSDDANKGEKAIKKLGDESDKASKKFRNTKSSAKSMGNAFSNVGKAFKGVSNIFKNATNSISKGMDKNVNKLKKFALGLIGVRTVMSLLTKSVNSYLSFDSDLQDSLTNSWNMLGSLLAPAIELVANLFSTATNYIYRFVQGLTGIDLVARANAKALEKQAKATQKAAAAQRSLLSMDEITNLPTESASTEANQISIGEIDTKGMFSDLLDAFKRQDWHRAGEIIAENINAGLKRIDWDSVRTKAESTGRNIATFLNGVFELDWNLLGSSIANTINTAIDMAYGFIDEFEWGRIGVGIGDAISSFFENFDFAKLGKTLTKFVNGLYETFSGLIAHLDVSKIGKGITEFIGNVDWLDLMLKVIDACFKGLKKSLEIRQSILGGIIGGIIDYVKKKIEEFGKEAGGNLGKFFGKAFAKGINLLIDGVNLIIAPMRAIVYALAKIIGKDVSFDDVKIPHIDFDDKGLAVGTNEIEAEGLYHLHEGEAVVPKKYNPATGGYDSGADNKQIIDLLISLNSSMIEYANRPIDIMMDGKKVAEGTYDNLQEIDKNRNKSQVVVRS